MDNPASTTDLTGRGYAIPASYTTDQAQARLDMVWRRLKRDVPTIEWAVSSGQATLEDVTDVVCAAASRSMRNTDGVTEESGAIDDWRESRKLADATEDIYFTAAELRGLTPPAAPTAGSMKYS